ncbi:MAG: PEP-CTERM sorting domain-containing protein [Pseudomonadota bacterium]
MKSQFSILLAATLFASANASADTLAQWTFETSAPTTAGTFAPEVGSGSALGFHASSSVVYSNPVGNGSGESFSSNYWSVGDYYQFQTSTVGYEDIVVSWDQASSNTGPRDFMLSYSTDGFSFANFAAYSVLANAAPNPTWTSSTSHPVYGLSFDLSSIAALDNQASVYFRLVDVSTVSANGGTVATAGTNRVDNFTVMAAPVPEAETYAMMLAGLGLVGFMARRRKA